MFDASIHWIAWFFKDVYIAITQISPQFFLCVGDLQVFHYPVILGAVVQWGCLLFMNLGVEIYICKQSWCNALSA